MHLSARTGLAALACGTAFALFAAPTTAHADEANNTTDVTKRRTVVVVVDFTDNKHADPEQVKGKAAERYFGATDSLVSYYKEISRGKYLFTPAVPEKVVGPIALPMAANCDSGPINSATQEALKARGLERGKDYDALSMILPPGKCGWAGLGSVPGPYTWINGGGSVDTAVLVHEFGHNLGFSHHMRITCADGDLANCTDNGTSHKTPMGGGGRVAGLSAPEMIRAGFLSAGEHVKAQKSGVYTLRALHGGGRGVKALEIPAGGDGIVLEYRHAGGTVDQRIEGVHAYRVRDGKYQSSALVDVTGPNHSVGGGQPTDDAIRTLTDKASGLTIEVRSTADGSATVAVGLDGEPAPTGQAAPPKAPAAPVKPVPQATKEGAPADEAGVEDAIGAAKPDIGGTGGTGGTGGNRTGADAPGGVELAETGGDGADALPLAAAGVALVALGAGAGVWVRRRNRTRAV